MSDELNGFTLDESQRKLNEISDILQQRLGNKWKIVIVLSCLFIFGIILLIVYGIQTETYQIEINHLKIFVIAILLGIIFFSIWFSITPYKDTTTYGVLPFPSSSTIVPVDSTKCGITPTLCESQSDCDAECKDSYSNDNYTCTKIEHPNFYYLGTQLDEGKQFCLPKTNDLDPIKTCGTYTGRIVWANSPSGQEWECQCLYPTLFGGDLCMDQKACALTEDDTNPPFLKDKDGNAWNPSAMPAELVNTTPYDMENGKPRFTCSAPDSYYTLSTDPFVSHQNICYAGTNSQSTAVFDMATQKCICSPPLVQSNISGFCYPTEDICRPQNNGCRYGVDLFDKGNPVVFKNGDKYYLSGLTDKNEEVLIDVSSLPFLGRENIPDITKTILKDAFYSFRVVDASLFPTALDSISKFTVLGKDGMAAKINDLFAVTAGSGGVAELCDSFFYRRDGSIKCEDPLNKSGTQSLFNILPACSTDGKNAVFRPDVFNANNKGYYCQCDPNNGTKSNEDNSFCNPCVTSGVKCGQDCDKVCCNGFDQQTYETCRRACNPFGGPCNADCLACIDDCRVCL